MFPESVSIITNDLVDEQYGLLKAGIISATIDQELFCFTVYISNEQQLVGGPIFQGDFPEEAKQLFGERLPKISEEEWKLISQPLDFYGFNIYQAGRTAKICRRSTFAPSHFI